MTSPQALVNAARAAHAAQAPATAPVAQDLGAVGWVWAAAVPLASGAAQAQSAHAEGGAHEPWVHVLPAGAFGGRDGRGPYTLDVQAVLAAFAAHGADLPVDYEHQSLEATAKTGPVPAAGWIKELQARADGIWARVAWTAEASGLLAAKAYRYLSPVFLHTPEGRVLELQGAGLVHSPNLRLQAAAARGPHAAAGPTTNHQPSNQEDAMTLEELKVALAAAQANLATTEAALQAAQATQSAASAPAAPDPALWVPLAQHQAVAHELATLQAAQATQRAEGAVQAAMAAGKLAPAMKEWALGYAKANAAGFEAFVASAPVVVSAQAMQAGQGAAQAANGAHGATLAETDAVVAGLLGITASDFAAAKAAQAAQVR